MRAPLVQLVHDVYYVGNDRVYAKVDRALVDTLQALSQRSDEAVLRRRHAEGADPRPAAERHPRAARGQSAVHDAFELSGEGKPSMQAVVAIPPPDLPHTYAEFDLDLGNPLQDVLGFFVHMGELLDGKPTNHLDMRKVLAKAKASDFLYYTVVAN